MCVRRNTITNVLVLAEFDDRSFDVTGVISIPTFQAPRCGGTPAAISAGRDPTNSVHNSFDSLGEDVEEPWG